MLVISRRPRESVTIGNCRVEVLDRRDSRVRLGIHAPREIPVFRSELLKDAANLRCRQFTVGSQQE